MNKYFTESNIIPYNTKKFLLYFHSEEPLTNNKAFSMDDTYLIYETTVSKKKKLSIEQKKIKKLKNVIKQCKNITNYYCNNIKVNFGKMKIGKMKSNKFYYYVYGTGPRLYIFTNINIMMKWLKNECSCEKCQQENPDKYLLGEYIKINKLKSYIILLLSQQ